MHLLCEPEAAVCLVPQGFLHEAEEAPAAGQCDGHGSQFPQDLLPLFDRYSFLASWDFVKDCMEAQFPMMGQLQCRCYGVNDPAKDELSSAPSGIALF